MSGLNQLRQGNVSAYKAESEPALYDASMESTGNLKVSERGQMSLPAAARHRWKLNAGGRVSYLDLGDAIVIIPANVDELRSELLGGIDDHVWASAATGFGDPELTTE